MKYKNILFISPIFYDYHILIINELKSRGANVFFYPERKYNLLFTVVNNFFNNYIEKFQEKYYLNIFSEITKNKVNIDYLFVNRGYKIPISFLKKIKEQYPNCKMLMNQWDSNHNNPFYHLLPYFDKITSFDFEDCEQKSLKYLPNFYTANENEEKNTKKDLEFLFLGVYNQERYAIIKPIVDVLKSKGLNFYIKLYLPLTFLVKELLRLNRIDFSIISFKKLNRLDYLKLLYRSKNIIDVSDLKQTGYSQRIIESFVCEKTIYTKNKFLIDEFGSEFFIYIGDKIGICNNQNKLNQKMFNKHLYSINQWIDTIFYD